MKFKGNSKPARSKNGRLSVFRSIAADGDSTDADWSAVKPSCIARLVIASTKLGGAIRFGYTRDGGAYSLGVYLDDDSETFYFSPSQDIEAMLDQMSERLEAISEVP